MNSNAIGRKDYASADASTRESLVVIAKHRVSLDSNPEYWQGIIDASNEQ